MKKFWKISFTLIAIAVWIASFVLYFKTNLFMEHRIVFWTSVGLIVVVALLSKQLPKFVLFSSGIYLLVINIMWLLPLAIWWTLIPMGIIGIMNYLYLELNELVDENLNVCVPPLLLVAVFVFVFSWTEDIHNRDNAMQKPLQSEVIEYVDWNRSEVNVFIRGERYSFSDVEQAQGINIGDTVQVKFYKNLILELKH